MKTRHIIIAMLAAVVCINALLIALTHLDEAIALNPRSAWFHRERGNTCKKMGEQELASADFAKARELEMNMK